MCFPFAGAVGVTCANYLTTSAFGASFLKELCGRVFRDHADELGDVVPHNFVSEPFGENVGRLRHRVAIFEFVLSLGPRFVQGPNADSVDAVDVAKFLRLACPNHAKCCLIIFVNAHLHRLSHDALEDDIPQFEGWKALFENQLV